MERDSVGAFQLLFVLAAPFVVAVLTLVGIVVLYLDAGVSPAYTWWALIVLPPASLFALRWLFGPWARR